jgi:hypothetical protein
MGITHQTNAESGAEFIGISYSKGKKLDGRIVIDNQISLMAPTIKEW